MTGNNCSDLKKSLEENLDNLFADLDELTEIINYNTIDNNTLNNVFQMTKSFTEIKKAYNKIDFNLIET